MRKIGHLVGLSHVNVEANVQSKNITAMQMHDFGLDSCVFNGKDSSIWDSILEVTNFRLEFFFPRGQVLIFIKEVLYFLKEFSPLEV